MLISDSEYVRVRMAQKVVTCSKIDGFPLLPEITIKNEGNRVVVRKVLPRPSHAPQAQIILIILVILTTLGPHNSGPSGPSWSES